MLEINLKAALGFSTFENNNKRIVRFMGSYRNIESK